LRTPQRRSIAAAERHGPDAAGTAKGRSGMGFVIGAWLRRYGPLELVGTLGALAAAGAAATLTGEVALAALAGAAGENVGFYGYAGWRSARGHMAAHGLSLSATDRARAWHIGRRTVADLAGEFGPAELLDSALLRPALLYAATRATGSVAVGVLLGKVLADLVFYGIAFASLTFLRRRSSAVTPQEVSTP